MLSSGRPELATFGVQLSVQKVEWIALDDERQERCEPGNATDVTGCLTRYLESVIGCRSYLLGSDPSRPQCTSKEQKKLVRKFRLAVGRLEEFQAVCFRRLIYGIT